MPLPPEPPDVRGCGRFNIPPQPPIPGTIHLTYPIGIRAGTFVPGTKCRPSGIFTLATRELEWVIDVQVGARRGWCLEGMGAGPLHRWACGEESFPFSQGLSGERFPLQSRNSHRTECRCLFRPFWTKHHPIDTKNTGLSVIMHALLGNQLRVSLTCVDLGILLAYPHRPLTYELHIQTASCISPQ